jgi:hypothetical protein
MRDRLTKALVGSRGSIISRPSQLDLDVRLSVHPAPDVLSCRFCSCERSRGSFREWLEGCFFSNFYGLHLHVCLVSLLNTLNALFWM